MRYHDEQDDLPLGHPTITAHPEPPEGGIRGKGIPPDVLVDWDWVPEPRAFAEPGLEAGGPPRR